VAGFWGALGGALVYSLLSLGLNGILLGEPRITIIHRRF
jgi:hypothetical protein